MQPIYLDYNATTPVAPAVREALLPFLGTEFGNPSSPHPLGQTARQALENARGQVAALLGAEADEIVFTSSGTEASNLAILGSFGGARGQGRGHLSISAVEHPATVAPARCLEASGVDLTVLPVTAAGVVRPADVEAALRPETRLVSIMHANNEVGTIQPIREIAAICRARGVLLHTDAVQSVGKIPVQVDELGVDLLSVAGHKIYAPKGVGALYMRRGTKIEPVLCGAGQERGVRPGTENVAFGVALGQAAALAHEDLEHSAVQAAALVQRLRDRLHEAVGEGLVENALGAERLPNTLSVSFLGVSGRQLLDRAAQVWASTGAACHAGQEGMSATLAAMGIAPEVARGTIRLSVGRCTRQDDVDRAVDRLIAARESL